MGDSASIYCTDHNRSSFDSHIRRLFDEPTKRSSAEEANCVWRRQFCSQSDQWANIILSTRQLLPHPKPQTLLIVIVDTFVLIELLSLLLNVILCNKRRG
ncbi:hypothetical protein ANCCAN_29540, partial [Ancylostoma caninum]